MRHTTLREQSCPDTPGCKEPSGTRVQGLLSDTQIAPPETKPTKDKPGLFPTFSLSRGQQLLRDLLGQQLCHGRGRQPLAGDEGLGPAAPLRPPAAQDGPEHLPRVPGRHLPEGAAQFLRDTRALKIPLTASLTHSTFP